MDQTFVPLLLRESKTVKLAKKSSCAAKLLEV